MGDPGGRPGSLVHIGALLAGADGLVGLLMCVGLLHRLLLCLWFLFCCKKYVGVSRQSWYCGNRVDLGTDGSVTRVFTIREI